MNKADKVAAINSLAYKLGISSHSLAVALFIAGEHCQDRKHVVQYGTIATDEIYEYIRELKP